MNILTLSAATGLALAIGATPARALNTPMQQYLELERTDYAVAGVGGIGAPLTQGGGSGTVHLAGTSGSVTLALLYWNGIDIEFPAAGLTGGDADYDQAQIHFDGSDIVGTRVGGFGSNDCWPSADATLPPSAATFRADVTDHVTLHGNGDYAFSGLTAKPGHSANGVSLIVYFDDGNPANDVRIAHYEGMQSNIEGAHFEFDMDYAGGSVEAIVHASDGQGLLTDGSLTWNALPGRPDLGTANTLKYTTLHDGLSLWPGSSVPHLGHQRNANPATLWDIRHMPLTPLFAAPRHYATHFDYSKSAQDCISVHVIQIVRPADAQAPMLSPSPHDFGDVIAGTTSPAKRFTFSNLMPDPVTVQTPTLGDATFQIAAQTCAGQTLTAGATCTIDVTFAPVGAQPAYPRTTALLVPFTDTAFKAPNPVKVYSTVLGTGVPSTPFSRLSFEPRTCAFKPTLVGATSAPVRITARSSGTLGLTIDSVAGGGTRFPLVASTCSVGLALAPGAACTLDLAFHPSAAGANSNAASIQYHASDAASGAGMSLPLSGDGLAGDLLFDDGFEQALCID